MTEYKCGSAKSCKFGEMCKPNFNIGACSHYKAEEPQTNEEWFCSLSTEEKAKVLNDTFWKCLNYVDEHELVDDDISEIYLRWLKEKHHDK